MQTWPCHTKGVAILASADTTSISQKCRHYNGKYMSHLVNVSLATAPRTSTLQKCKHYNEKCMSHFLNWTRASARRTSSSQKFKHYNGKCRSHFLNLILASVRRISRLQKFRHYNEKCTSVTILAQVWSYEVCGRKGRKPGKEVLPLGPASVTLRNKHATPAR